jgi:hypothetical protein
MHNCQQILNELFKDALKRMMLFWRLRDGTKMSDAKFVRCYLELFLGGGSYGNPRETQVGGVRFRDATLSRAYDQRHYE